MAGKVYSTVLLFRFMKMKGTEQRSSNIILKAPPVGTQGTLFAKVAPGEDCDGAKSLNAVM